MCVLGVWLEHAIASSVVRPGLCKKWFEVFCAAWDRLKVQRFWVIFTNPRGSLCNLDCNWHPKAETGPVQGNPTLSFSGRHDSVSHPPSPCYLLCARHKRPRWLSRSKSTEGMCDSSHLKTEPLNDLFQHVSLCSRVPYFATVTQTHTHTHTHRMHA